MPGRRAPVDDEGFNLPPRKTLWTYFREGLRRAHARRPMSFYLLAAIPIALLLGTRLLDVNASPERFAFYLSLFFVFFFVVLWRAIVDLIDIARKHFAESERVFASTLGDSEFVNRLGERVGEKREE